jgi:AcrR family transcriptional regulator
VVATKAERSLARGRRFEERRAEIADVAAMLFAERGYHATSIQAITDATQLKRGALYHYIEGKKDLLYQIHARFIEPLLANLREIAAREDPPEESLLQVAELIMRDMCLYREQITVFLHEWKVIKDDEKWSEALAQRREIEELVESILVRGCELGRFEIVDVRLAVLAFFGMMNWTYQWYDVNGRYSSHDVAEQFTNLFLNGVAKRS